ncbi:MAG: hypothetical protein V1827_01240 [Candidatus Micrarchaeota archaeon]
MKPATQERMGVVERKAKTGAFSAAVLVAGLALGIGCRNDVDAPQKPKTEQGTLAVKETVEKKVVREGEPLVMRHLLPGEYSYLEMLRVDKIDAEGITIAPFFGGIMDWETAGMVEIFMSEHDVKPLRMKYGESKTFRVGEFALVESLTVKVEKGPKPGTTTVTLTYSGPKTERTKDGKIRVPFLLEKNGYFEFDVPGEGASKEGVAAKKGCEIRLWMGSVSFVKVREGRCEVKKGDELLTAEFIMEKAGFISWEVGKIDDEGVNLDISMEIFMSEHADKEGAPIKIKYGESQAWEGMAIKAEKGISADTAILTITYPDAKTQ